MLLIRTALESRVSGSRIFFSFLTLILIILFFSKIVWRRFLFFAAGCSGSPAVIGYREIAGGKTSRADRTAVGVAFANEATILGIYPDDIPFSGGA